MIAAGTGRTRQKRHEWPVFTADGSIAVHYEHDVLITEEGPRVLTEGLEEIPDVI
jgi:methionyl aminopeptidase